MRTAIVISGNLRTFLMPTRENINVRLCDLFLKNIVLNNNADIFIFTDTNDFYHNDTQYYSTNNKIEILNNDAFRIHNNIKFIDNNTARNIISEQFKFFGENLKSFYIEDPFDPKNDPKFKQLNNANVKGSSPILLIHQFRKLKESYNLLKIYEKENNIKYDIIVKWRFDISVNGELNLKKYDYINNDIYVAGIHSPIIYDWHMFGNRSAMDKALCLYDTLGSFLHEGNVYVCDKCRKYNQINLNCLCGNNNRFFEITLAPEYHYFRLFKDNNIKYFNSAYQAYPYRYKDISTKESVDNIIKNLDIETTLISYTSGIEIGEKVYEKNKSNSS